MLGVKDVQTRLKTSYPIRISDQTKSKRLYNIETFRTVINDAIVNKHLEYGKNEERIYLYTTQAGQKIAIQFPGKESYKYDSKGKKKAEKDIRRFDFRPKIILQDGSVLKDLIFADMWSVLEAIKKEYPKLLLCLSALFFRMGRMVSHSLVSEEVRCEVVDQDFATIDAGETSIQWYKLDIPNDMIHALNYNASTIEINGSDGKTISFEAFIYFFDLILQNEDIKYNDKKNDLSSGRIQTSDSMLLLTSYFLGNTSLSSLLQHFVDGNGVVKCKNTEIGPATGDIIRIVNRKEDIISKLESSGIKYTTNSIITIDGNRQSVSLKVNKLDLVFLTRPDAIKKAILQNSKNKWKVYDFQSLDTCEEEYDQLIESYFS